MKIIHSARQTGKTTQLIQMCAENGGYIVCHSQEECQRIAALAEKLGFNIPFPVTHHEFLERQYYAPGVRRVYIDNVDMMLQHVSRVPIEAITLTKEDREG